MSHTPFTIRRYVQTSEAEGTLGSFHTADTIGVSMSASTTHTVDVDALLQSIGAWLREASDHGERRLVICAVQRGHGIELVDGTPLELVIPRLADVT